MTLVPANFACCIRLGSQGSKSSFSPFMNRIRASAIFGTSAAVGSYSSQSPSGPTMVTRSTRSPATLVTMSPITLKVATTLILSAAAATAGQRQDGPDRQRQCGKNQPFHRSFPLLLARTKFAVAVASSETPYSAPAAMTIAGPDGRLR